MQENDKNATTLTTHDFYYDLPEELIAQTPIDPRDHSRLLVYDRATDTVQHKHFYDLPSFLKKGDLLVVNNTRVIPARIFGHIENHESVLEVLLLKRKDYTHWETIMKPARKARLGSVIHFCDELSAVVTEIGDYGARTIEFKFDGVFEDILDRVGNMPLPPYIKEKLADKERYQTVYSKIEGSAAAPTAGLHFTPELIQKLKDMGVEFATVLLHIGLGTFRPVKEENILDHEMHTEYYEIDEENAEKSDLRRHDKRAYVGNGGRRKRIRPCAERRHEHLHISRLQVQVRQSTHHQLPFARKHVDYACIRACWQRKDA